MGQEARSKCHNKKVLTRGGKQICAKCKRELAAEDIHTVNTKFAGKVQLS